MEILVIDISATTPADEASRILSEPVSRGYYLKNATSGDPMRCVFALPVSKHVEKPVTPRGFDGATAALRKILESEPHMGINRLQRALAEQGLNKGTRWVSEMRAKVLGAEVRLESLQD